MGLEFSKVKMNSIKNWLIEKNSLRPRSRAA